MDVVDCLETLEIKYCMGLVSYSVLRRVLDTFFDIHLNVEGKKFLFIYLFL